MKLDFDQGKDSFSFTVPLLKMRTNTFRKTVQGNLVLRTTRLCFASAYYQNTDSAPN